MEVYKGWEMKPILHLLIDDKAYQVLLSEQQKQRILKLIQRPNINYVRDVKGALVGNEEFKGIEDKCLNIILEESDV